MHDAFLEKLVTRVKKLIISDPFDAATQIGALISRKHMEKVLGYVSDGKREGAELIYGGAAVQDTPLHLGNFLQPAIFSQCKDKMTIVRDEIFGPVMSVLVFDDEDEVIARANNSHYGLAAGVFTENIKTRTSCCQTITGRCVLGK